jgi:two-component system chemotaxis response regulator CheY
MANILIVDDSVSIRKMVKFALETAEHKVVEATDGKTGLAEAQQEQYDIVVTDVNMPNMDGIELTRNLRTLPNYKYTPIIMLTTEAMEEKKAEGKAAGVTGWILKPFQPNKLIAVVNKVA